MPAKIGTLKAESKYDWLVVSAWFVALLGLVAWAGWNHITSLVDLAAAHPNITAGIGVVIGIATLSTVAAVWTVRALREAFSGDHPITPAEEATILSELLRMGRYHF
jgi:hypothetical protein